MTLNSKVSVLWSSLYADWNSKCSAVCSFQVALETVVSRIFEKTCKLIFSVVCFLFCFLAKEAQLLQWLLERKGDNTRHNLVIRFQHSCTWYVEMGWSIHDFFGDLRMISLTCCSAAREKVSWQGPQKTKKSGCQAVQHQTHPSISGTLPWRNLQTHRSGRSTVGMELGTNGRVLPVLFPNNWCLRSLPEELF